MIRRFRARSLGEVRERGSQAAAIWLERLGLRDTHEYGPAELDARLLHPWSESIDPVVRGPFFESLRDREATLAALLAIDPEYEHRLRKRADRLCQGRFDLLGYRDLQIDEPVDWALDAVSGVRAPAGHWSTIRFLDFTAVGDHKVTWELNRHQFLVTLAQAWWVTHDSRYVDVCVRHLESWMEGNPPKRSVNWASSLEIAYRSIAWIWTLALLGDALPAATRRRVLSILIIAGRHLERYLSTYFSPNTHLSGEALGLFYLGTVIPQARDATRWRSRGASVLAECLPLHARGDGVYVEQATWYHRYTVDIFSHLLLLSERSGLDARPWAGPALERMIEYLMFISRPNGTMPIVGDDDGGKLIFLDEGTSHNVRAALQLGAVLFDRNDFAFVGGAPVPELVWLAGKGGLDRYRGLVPREPATASRAFTEGGVYVMRDGWSAGSSVMAIDAGPHGFLNGGHAHADALSVDFAARGQPLFVDPGTHSYVSARWRDHLRHTSAHNAATVDGRSSATPEGPFRWKSVAHGRALAWHVGAHAVLFAGTHDGFQGGPAGVKLERAVVFVPPDLWLVHDWAAGAGEHALCAHWQCAPGVVIRAVETGRLEIAINDVAVAQLLTPPGMTPVAEEGWVAPTYGSLEAAPHLLITASGRDVVSVATAVCLTIDTRASVVAAPDGLAAGVEVAWGNRRGMLLRGGAEAGGLDIDAGLAFVELDDQGEATHATCADVGRIAHRGVALLAAGERMAGVSATRLAGTWQIDRSARSPSAPMAAAGHDRERDSRPREG